MAEEEVAGKAGKGALDFLKTKIGPLPLGVWGVGGLAAFLIYQRRKAASSSTSGGQQIDSAGNVGTIDTATGYVQGSPQDIAALGQNNNGSGGSTDTSAAGSGATVAGQYATNDDWSRAAVNFLVGLGIDPTTATQAIQQYLASQSLTTAQQGDVNLAIQSLGAPPTLPSPSQTNPTPVSTPPSGTVNASNPPTGVKILPFNTSKTTVSIGWNKAANATGYTVSIGTNTAGNNHETTQVPAGQLQFTFGSLKPGTKYYARVQATPAAAGAGWGGPVSTTTAK
jgi:hypothetical protein